MTSIATTAVREFRDNGFAVIRNFFSDAQIERLASVALELHDAKNRHIQAGTTRGRLSFTRTHQLWQQSEEVREIAFESKLAEVSAEMLGCESLRIIDDDVFEKRPGDRVSKWHYDAKFIPIDNDRYISIWVPLVDVTHDMGTMAYVRGSHKMQFVEPKKPLAGEVRGHLWYTTQFALRNTRIDRIEARRGDVLFHHGNTMHMAGANRSKTRRVAYGLHFADARSRFVPPANDSQRVHVRDSQWGHLRPGDEIESVTSPEVLIRADDRRITA
ncbi:MAG: phytanoyl-CoA dioxygenase family protein [Vulcanimicrobiaceae bacterium]